MKQCKYLTVQVCLTIIKRYRCNPLERMNLMADEILLTYAGLHELEAELEQLKTVGRKEVAEKSK